MKQALLVSLTFIFLCLLQPVAGYAAFPVNMETAPAPVMESHISFKDKVRSAIKQYTTPAPVAERVSGEGWFGVAALVLGVAGALFLGVGIAVPTLGFLGTIGFLSAILAIIFGAIGLKKPNSSMARAGMILGIVEIGLLLFFAILALLLFAAFYK